MLSASMYRCGVQCATSVQLINACQDLALYTSAMPHTEQGAQIMLKAIKQEQNQTIISLTSIPTESRSLYKNYILPYSQTRCTLIIQWSALEFYYTLTQINTGWRKGSTCCLQLLIISNWWKGLFSQGLVISKRLFCCGCQPSLLHSLPVCRMMMFVLAALAHIACLSAAPGMQLPAAGVQHQTTHQSRAPPPLMIPMPSALQTAVAAVAGYHPAQTPLM